MSQSPNTPQTKVLRVPGGVAVVFHHAGQPLDQSRVAFSSADCLAFGGEAHEVDFEQGTDDFRRIAMDNRRHPGKTEAFIFEDADGRSQGVDPAAATQQINASLAPKKGLLSVLTRSFG